MAEWLSWLILLLASAWQGIPYRPFISWLICFLSSPLHMGLCSYIGGLAPGFGLAQCQSAVETV